MLQFRFSLYIFVYKLKKVLILVQYKVSQVGKGINFYSLIGKPLRRSQVSTLLHCCIVVLLELKKKKERKKWLNLLKFGLMLILNMLYHLDIGWKGQWELGHKVLFGKFQYFLCLGFFYFCKIYGKNMIVLHASN